MVLQYRSSTFYWQAIIQLRCYLPAHLVVCFSFETFGRAKHDKAVTLESPEPEEKEKLEAEEILLMLYFS